MVGHEVDDDLHACLVRALHQLLKLLHTLLDVDRQVGVYVVVVGNGVRRACPTLHHRRMLAGNSVPGVIGHRCVTDDARVPNMAHAHLTDMFQYSGREVVHLSTTVLLNRTTGFAGRVTVGVQTGENLIEYYFMRFHVQSRCGQSWQSFPAAPYRGRTP